MNGLALCAGIAGLELGVGLVVPGYRTACYVEREAYAAAVLAARMEDGALDPAPIWADLTRFNGLQWRGVVDIVTAGFPCQPFSVAGNRKGVQDKRWIWPDIARIIRDVRPRIVFLENVPGIVVHGLAAVLGSLADSGFDAEWGCFSAADIGAPHRRKRWFLVAHRNGRGFTKERGAEGEREHPRRNEPDRRGGPRAVADTERDTIRNEQGRLGGQGGTSTPFPPNPGVDWGGWLQEWPGTEPSFRRGVDGAANWVDELRATGNAVVPAVAALAFAQLGGLEI